MPHTTTLNDPAGGFDIIGDIHGHADALKQLLGNMGYVDMKDGFRHPTRTAVFLGDFIDRGPGQREVLQTVMPMVQSGAALAIMGNHELNAIGFHTQMPQFENIWLRPRNNKNIVQHQAFMNEYLAHGREGELNEVMDFFKSLPLWIDLPGFRVVHACWHPEYMETLKPHLDDQNRLKPGMDNIVRCFIEGKPFFRAIEGILKGLECDLPDGISYRDKEGTVRHRTRVRWWHQNARTFGEMTLSQGASNPTLDKYPVPAGVMPGYGHEEKPVFFGHYWFTGTPVPIAHNVACLDYSVASKGKLVAYRWNGEQSLRRDGFVYSGRERALEMCL